MALMMLQKVPDEAMCLVRQGFDISSGLFERLQKAAGLSPEVPLHALSYLCPAMVQHTLSRHGLGVRASSC